MTPLSEVAADVAQALGLAAVYFDGGVRWYVKIAKHTEEEGPAIEHDGSNLTDPHWRCSCEDWLHKHNWRLILEAEGWGEHIAQEVCKTDQIKVLCSLAEAPARLVSAVWRRMQG